MQSIRELRAIMRHDVAVMGHEFIQDLDDIPGGCKTCWDNLEAADVE
jgi:hypothetical protein